ncbi:hypothetical protein K2173_009076 [Erythroxylum novogranatense]|uniref:Remorin C-terminal domain-containing protein n=1 Tax=Erythroxylum novogranatense TaxID=1862640 RepID=A0AAV8TVP1_9ROSI|nr:hypothetical protein K2173_009076 [Erythroxylum novogranatense]
MPTETNTITSLLSMDYERIEKSQGGGLSPGKLRNILLKVEKKSNEEEVESVCSLTSRPIDLDETGGDSSGNCKDVDVDTVLPECFTSTLVETMAQMSTEQGPQRLPFAPFSKGAPSKWDDAHKWIASPNWHHPKTGQMHLLGSQGIGSRKKTAGYLNRQASANMAVEVPEHTYVAFEESDTASQAKKEIGTNRDVGWESNSHPIAESYGKPVLMIENSVVNHSQHNSSLTMHSASTFIPPPSTSRSVSLRDMGTEMTPTASQEPSRTATPVRASTPIRSPTSSRPSSPDRAVQSSFPTYALNNHLGPKNELSERELQMKTRREIMVLGTQLGKLNVAAWASKEEDDKDSSTSLRTVATEQPTKSVIEMRAAAWAEAEKAKYLARFKREETKIQAWENHQKAKTEAEMRKIEVEVERMRAEGHDRIMNKLASLRHKAEEKRAAAEAHRNWHAAKAEQQADYIRKNGRMPYSFSCCGWCS